MTSTNNLGGLLRSMGRLAEAETYFREGFDARRRVLGEDHGDTLQSMNNLGELLLTMGRPDEAEPYLRKSLDARRRLLGQKQPRHTAVL